MGGEIRGRGKRPEQLIGLASSSKEGVRGLKRVPSSSLDRRAKIASRKSRKSSFFRRVYRLVRKIPRGKVLTYGQIATLVGAPYMARQVGWAMHGCPPGLPWHRVIGAGGKILINSLSAGEGPLLQRKLLELEGVRFIGKHVDMVKHQWISRKKIREARL
jgi:methylated-DNA-protein-cysteine methyltransferase related protein